MSILLERRSDMESRETNIDLRRVSALHDGAMKDAELAELAKLDGDPESAKQHYRHSYDKEAKAARMLAEELDFEPSRSVLYRSAASLAILCGEHDEAEELIATGLAGNPPAEIAEELRELRR
jgi:hypothetical protein